LASDILVGEVAPGLGERRDLSPEPLELHERHMALEGLADEIAAAPAHPAAQPIQLPPQTIVQANRDR
jgi:hypothetical protein